MLGGLFGGKPQTQTSSTTIAEYVEDPVKSLIADATRVAGMPYVGYEGPRIAGLTQPSQTAISGIQSRYGQPTSGRGIYDALMSGTMMGTPGQVGREQIPSWVSGLSGAGIMSMMDPYQKAVSDITARELTRRSDIAGQQDAAAAVQAGAFGGSRQAVLEAERRRNLEQQVGDVYTQGGSQAYNTAIQTLLAQRGQDIGQRSTDIGASIEQRGQDIGQRAQDIGLDVNRTQAALQAGQQGFAEQQAKDQTMLGIGSLLQGQTQSNLDLAYGDFLRQQQNPQQQLGFLSNIIRGVPYSQTTTSQVSGGGASPFQQLLGAGIGGLSLAGGLGWKPFG